MTDGPLTASEQAELNLLEQRHGDPSTAGAAPQPAGLNPSEQYEMQMLQHQQHEMAARSDADPTSGMPWYQQGAVGFGRGLVHTAANAVNAIPQMVDPETGEALPAGKEGVTDEDLQRMAKIDQPILNRGWGKVGNMLGETAATLPLTAGAGTAASLGLRGLGAGARLATAGNMAAQGATMGATTADPGKRAEGAFWGALSGPLPAVAAHGLGVLAHGIARTPAAQTLLDKGIDLFPSQLNPEGYLARAAETARHWPVVGKFFENARADAAKQFRQKLVQEVAPPADGGGLVPIQTDGERGIHEMMNDVQGKYKEAWAPMDATPLNPTYRVEAPTPQPESAGLSSEGNPLPPPKVPPTSQQDLPVREALKQELGRATDEAAHPFVTGAKRATAQDNMQRIAQMIDNIDGQPTVGDMRVIRSQIKSLKRDYSASQDPADKKVAAMWKDADSRITQFITGALNPADSKKFGALDWQYARYKKVEDAVKKSLDRPEGFTPHMLSQAVTSGTSPYQIANGSGMLRDWSGPFADVFAQRLPVTGIRGPALAATMMGAAAAPGVAAGVGAGTLAAYKVPALRHMLQGQGALNVPFKLPAAVANMAMQNPVARTLAIRYANQLGVPQALVGAGQNQADVDAQRARAVGSYAHNLMAPHAPAAPAAPEPQMAKGGKVQTVMHEWKHGQLHSGSKKGPVVKSQKQAVAIALSEQRKANKGG